MTDLDDDQLEQMPMGRLVAVAGQRLVATWGQLLGRHGLTPSAAIPVLLVLTNADGLSHREVARRAWLSPATITAVADTMEAEGLIRRERDVDDRRVVRLRITDRGREYAGRAAAVVSAELSPLFPSATAEHEAVVRRYLAEIIRRFPTEGERQ